MAHLALNKNKQAGSVLLEGLWGVSAALAIVFLILAAAYLIFARAWINYQMESALLCIAQGQPQATCQRQLKNSLQTFIPWGESKINLLNGAKDQWKADLEWRWLNYKFAYQKNLSIKSISTNRVLHW